MRLRFRYSLKFFLLCWLLIGLSLGWFGIHWQRASRQAAAARAIAIGSVTYDYQSDGQGFWGREFSEDPDSLVYSDWNIQHPENYFSEMMSMSTTAPVPPEPAWLLNALGVDFFHPVTSYGYPDMRCGNMGEEPKMTPGLGREMDHLSALPRLRHFYLWPDAIDVPQLMESSLFTQLGKMNELEQLWIGGMPVTAEQLSQLKDHAQLRRLILTDAEITDEALAALGTLPSLEELDLSRCPTIGKTGLPFLAKWKKLRRVELGETACDSRIWISLSTLTNLETLNLSQASISPVIVRELRKLPKLKQLSLAGVQLTDAELAEALRGWTNLESLDLSETNAGEQFAAACETLTSLKFLNLYDAPLSADEALSEQVTEQLADGKIWVGMTANGPWFGAGPIREGLGGSGFGSADSSDEDADSSEEPLDATSTTGDGFF